MEKRSKLTVYMDSDQILDLRRWAADLGTSHGILARAIIETALEETREDQDVADRIADRALDLRSGNGRRSNSDDGKDKD